MKVTVRWIVFVMGMLVVLSACESAPQTVAPTTVISSAAQSTPTSVATASTAAPTSAPTRVAATSAPTLNANTARVYTADQSSNTISVIDPATDTLLGQIALGNPRPNVLGAKYYKQINVHGLGYSPDGQTLVVVSVGSNAVTFIDTATHKVNGTVYVGRAPHEAFFTPNGKEVWVAVRGQDYLSVIDAATMKEARQIKTMSNPSKVMFRPDGKYAFVDSAEVAEFDVIDTATYSVTARVEVVSPFSPDLSVTPDGKEVWLGHKDVGKVTQIDAQTFKVMNVIDTGKITNHTAPVSNANGDFVYVTVGGTHEVVVIKRGSNPTIVKRIPVGADPHGIWPSPDNTRVYIGLENGDAVQVIDTLKNEVIKTIPIGQAPQALVVVPGARGGSENLQMAVVGKRAMEIALRAADSKVSGTAVVREQQGTDAFDLSLSGLQAKAKLDVFLTQNASAPFGAMTYLGSFTADDKGSVEAGLSAAVFNATAFAADGTKQSLRNIVIWNADSSPLGGNAGTPLLLSTTSVSK